MIQDIYPHKLYNEYHPTAKVQEDSLILNIQNGKVLVDTEKFNNHMIHFPVKKELPEELEYTYLFKIDDREYFLWNKELPENLIPEGYSYVEERDIERVWGDPQQDKTHRATGCQTAILLNMGGSCSVSTNPLTYTKDGGGKYRV